MEDCQAIRDRARLTEGIARATHPQGDLYTRGFKGDGSEGEMLNWFDVLTGIVNEYRTGGDQIVETCTCGKHVYSKDAERTQIGESALIVDIKDSWNIDGDRRSKVPSIAIYLETPDLITNVAHLTWDQAQEFAIAISEVVSVAENG